MKSIVFKFLFSAVCALTAVTVQAQLIIAKFAGDTTLSTSSGDFGPAISAGLNQPFALAKDASGNIYIGEANGNRVRAVSTTGTIITAVGTGAATYTGDGGIATAATVFGPEGLAFDAAGNLFIADAGNNVIRKVNCTTYTISTVAGTGASTYGGDGGPASAAIFHSPRDIKFDAAGNMYICDWFNRRVRKISTTDTVTTIAGNGSTGLTGDGGPATSAAIDLPYRTAFGPSGNLFLVSSGTNTVRMINMTTGIITSVVGTGAAGFSGDGGPASAAKLNSPTAIAFDAAGNMFIADRGNDRIREVAVGSDTITTVVGIGMAHESGDFGPATAASINKTFDLMFDAAGHLYMADANGNVVRRLLPISALSTGQFASLNPVSLSPNPGGGRFTVEGSLSVSADEQVTLEVVNMLGQTVYKRKILALNGLISAQVQMDETLPGGMYLLHIRSEDAENIVRFMLQH